MKYQIYFQDRNDNSKMVGTVENDNLIFPKIKDYIAHLNPSYKIYYIRNWEEDGKIWYDVGSHSEFFYVEKIE